MRIRARSPYISDKNKTLSREFESEDLRARLFFLPEDLMRFVKAELRQGRLRWVEAQIAVAVAILLVAPLRPQNLIALNSSRNVKEPQGTEGQAGHLHPEGRYQD